MDYSRGMTQSNRVEGGAKSPRIDNTALQLSVKTNINFNPATFFFFAQPHPRCLRNKGPHLLSREPLAHKGVDQFFGKSALILFDNPSSMAMITFFNELFNYSFFVLKKRLEKFIIMVLKLKKKGVFSFQHPVMFGN